MARATAHITVQQLPQRAYAFMTDPVHAPEWSGLILSVRDVHSTTPGGEGWCTLTSKFLGRTFVVTYRSVMIEHPLTLLLEATGSPVPHTNRSALAPRGNGTELSLTVDSYPNDFFELPVPLVMSVPQRQLQADLLALKQLLEVRARGSPQARNERGDQRAESRSPAFSSRSTGGHMTQQEQPQQLSEFMPKFFAKEHQTLDQALEDHRIATREYREWLESIPGASLHTPVEPSGWSPAEHADHILKGAELITSMLASCAKGQAMPEMPMGYQHANGRVATDALVPTPGRAREELLADLTTWERRLEEAVTELREAGKLDVPCVATGLFTPLNTLEAVQLAADHYTRHMPQPTAEA